MFLDKEIEYQIKQKGRVTPNIGIIRKNEAESVDKIIRANPVLKNCFNERWIRRELFCTNQRLEVHPLFWSLLSEDHLKILLSFLGKENIKGKNKVIKKIKSDKDNFYSYMGELIVGDFYSGLFDTVEYEPATNQKGDFLFTHSGYREFFTEVISIENEKEWRDHESISGRIKYRLNSILQKDKICVNLDFKELLSEESDIELVVQGVLDGLISPFSIFSISKNKKPIVIVKPFLANKGVGYVGFKMVSPRWLREGRRVKDKLRDKINKFQFPEKCMGQKGIVALLFGVLLDIDDFYEALFGQEVLLVRKDGTHALSRTGNGLVHEDKLRDKLLELDFIVGMPFNKPKNRKPIFKETVVDWKELF